jgi:hypothetical protein
LTASLGVSGSPAVDFSQVYFSFFFVGSFIAFAVTGAFAVFLLTLKNKSSATLHLGFSLGFLALFNMAYLIPYSIYHPLAAYHRWFTVGTILPAVLHFTQFLLRFPKVDHPRLTTALLVLQWLIHIAITTVFIISSSKTGVVFNAQGHYFDLDADSISTVQAAFILGYILFSVVVGVWRYFIRRGAHRWALLSQALILFFVMMIPATLNSLSPRRARQPRAIPERIRHLCCYRRLYYGRRFSEHNARPYFVHVENYRY